MTVVLTGLCAIAAAHSQTPPGTLPASALDDSRHIAISNGLISAMVYPPGDNELYKGVRFDHAGVVLHITYKRQDYSDYWFDRFTADPSDVARYPGNVQHACCAVSGPVEEFAPVGFDEAGPGGRFLKPGVGILERNADQYRQFSAARILNAGTRSFKSSSTSARFLHRLEDKASGYGYVYTKTVSLVPGKPEMVIDHVLVNTGSKPIATSVYDHNFLTLSPGNEHIAISAPFAMTAQTQLQPDLARVEGSAIRFVAPIPPGVTVSSPVTGFGPGASDYDFTIANTATGFGERVRADQPVNQINFWSVRTALGWEPYIAIDLKPGETKRWTYTYDFFGPGDEK